MARTHSYCDEKSWTFSHILHYRICEDIHLPNSSLRGLGDLLLYHISIAALVFNTELGDGEKNWCIFLVVKK